MPLNWFQLLFLPLCVAASLVSLTRAARGHVSRRHGLFWTATWATAAGLIARPSLTSTFASWMGIGRGADLVFYLAIVSGLVACLYFYSRYRRLEIVVTEILRRQAMEGARRGKERIEMSPERELKRVA